MKMKQQFKSNFNLKNFIRIWIFLIGVGILVWQSQSTFATFFSFKTTVAISQQTYDSLSIPTFGLCQDYKWDNGGNPKGDDNINLADKDWILKQFYQLNEKMNISLLKSKCMS